MRTRQRNLLTLDRSNGPYTLIFEQTQSLPTVAVDHRRPCRSWGAIERPPRRIAVDSEPRTMAFRAATSHLPQLVQRAHANHPGEIFSLRFGPMIQLLPSPFEIQQRASSMDTESCATSTRVRSLSGSSGTVRLAAGLTTNLTLSNRVWDAAGYIA